MDACQTQEVTIAIWNPIMVGKSEYDHGYGLQHAINLAKMEIKIRKENAEKAKKEQ